MLVRDLVEPARELRNLVAGDGDSSGCPVAAESKQMRTRLSERAVQIELWNRSTGSFPLVVGQCDEHRWSPKLFDQSRSDDPDHTRMPCVIGQDDREPLIEIHRQHTLARLLQRLMIDLLAPGVQFLELARDDVRLVFIAGKQKLDAANGVTHS